jgi:cytochrome c-type biogenesis protein CcmF
VLVGIAFSVLWGTLFPIMSEAVRGEKITVGPPFFNAVNIPLGLLLFGLTGVGPLIAWRRASLSNLRRQFLAPVTSAFLVLIGLVAAGMRDAYALIAYFCAGFVTATIVQEFAKGVGARRSIHGESLPLAFIRLVARNRRRYGGYVVHAGIVLMFVSFAGLAFKKEFDVSLTAGQSYQATDPYGNTWRFESQGISTSQALNRNVTAVALDAWRNGKHIGLIKSEKRQYFDQQGQPTFEPSTEVGIHTDARLDTYIVLAGVRDDVAELRITFNPLVVWAWIGGFMLAIGGLIVMWPQAQRLQQSGYRAQLRPAGAELVGAA